MNKTDDELKQIALGIHKNEIFTNNHIRDIADLHLVFMPLIFMKEEQINEMKSQDIGMLYEYMSKASPRSMNGYPVFMSFEMITDSEAKIVIEYVKKYREAEQTVV